MSESDLTPLRDKAEELVRSLSEALSANAFTSRYVLHPRRFEQTAAGLASSFIGFLDSSEARGVTDFGSSLSRQGVGPQALFAILATLFRFCRTAAGAQIPEGAERALACFEAYCIALLDGFTSAWKAQILSDQEQLRRALSSALESQSRELFVKNHAIDTSINGILLTDLDGTVTYANRSCLALLGYEVAEELIGRNVADFWIGSEAGELLGLLSRADGWRGELAAKRKDGETRPVSFSASQIMNERGEAIGIMTSFVDMTEARRLELQMQQVQKMDDLGQLAGGIAHDFNNLLTAIGGHLQLLLAELPPEDAIYQELTQIKSAVDRGIGLTRQLRYFTRQASGKREIVNLNLIARETYELLKHSLAVEVTARLDLSDSLWSVEADPNQMSQVLMNLCVNAREAVFERRAASAETERGVLTIETENVTFGEVEARRHAGAKPGRYVSLAVSDTGVGVPPELVDRVFVPFVTTKASKHGTGLGLAVVYGIVRSHGGFVEVTSVPGKRTTFRVYLPMVDRTSKPVPGIVAKPVLSRGEGTILVVDDEEQVREVMVRTLVRCGYRVLEASSGAIALGIFKEQGPQIDLVVLDMIMPEVGGRKTLELLREVDPQVSVLLVTGYMTDDVGQEGLPLIEKPLDLALFSERVRELVAKRP